MVWGLVTYEFTSDQSFSWSIELFFENHLLEVGLTQNQESTTIRTLTIVGLFYFIMCEGPHE